jgi:hypothetical protein
VAPPTATGVAGGVPETAGVLDAFAERLGLGIGLAVGRGVAGRGVVATGVGLGVGSAVGFGVVGSVTVIVPPGAVAREGDATKVTVQVPGDVTRADWVQVGPVAGFLNPIRMGAQPVRVSWALTDVGSGFPFEST